MWETIGWWVLVFLAAYGALTLLERFLRTVIARKKQASFVLKLREVPASKEEISEKIDALLAERMGEKDIEVTAATRRKIRRDVVDELAREDLVR